MASGHRQLGERRGAHCAHILLSELERVISCKFLLSEPPVGGALLQQPRRPPALLWAFTRV